MKDVYVVLLKWYSPFDGVMVASAPDSDDMEIFSSKKRAIDYLRKRRECDMRCGRVISYINSDTGEYEAIPPKGEFPFKKEYVLVKKSVNIGI